MDSEISKENLAEDLETRPLSIVVLESFVVLFGLLLIVAGNVLVLLTIYRNTRLRRPANLYIASLAVTDLLTGVLPLSLGTSAVIMGEWKLGWLGCRFSYILGLTLAATSIFTMLLIAVNRYFKIVKPNKYSSVFSLKFIVASIMLAWVLALAFPWILSSHGSGIEFHPGYAICVLRVQTEDIVAVLTATAVLVPLPFCSISLLYYKIWIFVRKHNAHMNQSQVNLEELKLTKSLFVVVGSFIICYLPYSVAFSMDAILRPSLPRQFYFFCSTMVMTASFINPIIYGAMNRQYRKEFRKIVHSCCASAEVGPTNT